MACNVFGTPVTLETVMGLPQYEGRDAISTKDLADVALALKNAEGKDINARSYVENMYNKNYNDLCCVLGLIYNATGSRLTFHRMATQCFLGFVGPAPYPDCIENGQWGAFLSVTEKKEKDIGTGGAVVYHGRDLDGTKFGFFVGWDTSVRPAPVSHVSVQMGGPRAFENDNYLLQEVQKSDDHSVNEGSATLLSTAMLGSDKMAVLEVIHRPKPTAPLHDD